MAFRILTTQNKIYKKTQQLLNSHHPHPTPAPASDNMNIAGHDTWITSLFSLFYLPIFIPWPKPILG